MSDDCGHLADSFLHLLSAAGTVVTWIRTSSSSCSGSCLIKWVARNSEYRNSCEGVPGYKTWCNLCSSESCEPYFMINGYPLFNFWTRTQLLCSHTQTTRVVLVSLTFSLSCIQLLLVDWEVFFKKFSYWLWLLVLLLLADQWHQTAMA